MLNGDRLVKRVECEICGKLILGHSYLKRHRKVVHNEFLLDKLD